MFVKDEKDYTYECRTRKGLADALPGSGPKLVEDASALVLQETLTRFGLNSHHQRDLEVKRSEGPPAVDQAASHAEHVRPTTDGRQSATMHLND